MRENPVEQIFIPERPKDDELQPEIQRLGVNLPLIGNEGSGVFAICDSGETKVFASRHLSNHISVTVSHSKARSSVEGHWDRGVL